MDIPLPSPWRGLKKKQKKAMKKQLKLKQTEQQEELPVSSAPPRLPRRWKAEQVGPTQQQLMKVVHVPRRSNTLWQAVVPLHTRGRPTADGGVFSASRVCDGT